MARLENPPGARVKEVRQAHYNEQEQYEAETDGLEDSSVVTSHTAVHQALSLGYATAAPLLSLQGPSPNGRHAES